MNDCRLQKTQKNRVFEIIKEVDLQPQDFIWESITKERCMYGPDSGTISLLRHIGLRWYFEFDLRNYDSGFFYTLSPGGQAPVRKGDVPNWEMLEREVKNWLSYVKNEEEAPDLWSLIENTSTVMNQASHLTQDEIFTEQEQKVLSKGLNKFESYLIEMSKTDTLHEEKLNQALENIVSLRKELKSSSKWVWFHTTLGVLFTLAVGLHPDLARQIMIQGQDLLFSGYSSLIQLLE